MSSYPAQELLDRAGKDLAFLCPHQYTRDLAAIDSGFRKLSKMIDTTPGCGHLKIAVTEWNVSGGEWGLTRARQMTLETALFNARHLHIMMRHCDKVEIANRSNMANSFCGGAFETNAAGILKRPSFHVMSLYAHHFRPVPLQVDYDTNAADVFACASPDKKAVTIFVVNLKPEPRQFRIASPGFATPLRIVGAEAVFDVQQDGQADVMNHWDDPERVRSGKLTAAGREVMLPPLSISAIDCEAKE
jgi:alpha-L-arabinofuranosidase